MLTEFLDKKQMGTKAL